MRSDTKFDLREGEIAMMVKSYGGAIHLHSIVVPKDTR